jgi:hypothetical protein
MGVAVGRSVLIARFIDQGFLHRPTVGYQSLLRRVIEGNVAAAVLVFIWLRPCPVGDDLDLVTSRSYVGDALEYLEALATDPCDLRSNLKCVYRDRLDHAHRAGGQKCYPDRGPRHSASAARSTSCVLVLDAGAPRLRPIFTLSSSRGTESSDRRVAGLPPFCSVEEVATQTYC